LRQPVQVAAEAGNISTAFWRPLSCARSGQCQNI